MELQLVDELRCVAAQEHQLRGPGLGHGGLCVLDAEQLVQPPRLLDQVLDQERERLGDRVVAEQTELERQPRVRVGVVLCVAALVEERGVVVTPTVRRDHQVDLVGDARSRAKRSRGLRRPRLRVEVDVALAIQVYAQARQR
jgi:hypothetical protein